MAQKTFTWASDLVYAGGGQRRENRVDYGYLAVGSDEGVPLLEVCPNDDFYSGDLTDEEAIALAKAILEAAKIRGLL